MDTFKKGFSKYSYDSAEMRIVMSSVISKKNPGTDDFKSVGKRYEIKINTNG